MALWGISTTSETAANNYAIPKHLLETDRNTTPWNCFADVRGWVVRRYKTKANSGISTRYYDEVLVPVVGLNTTNTGGTPGIGVGGPVAVFFEDPNQASPISVGGGGTTGITTGQTGYVHVVFNELVFAGAGSTVRIRAFDANGANESTAIIGYASSNGNTQYAWAGDAATHGSPNVYTEFNGQITNRVAFGFTAPSTVLTANVPFLITATTSGQTVGVGATVIFVDSVSGVSVGSSVTITGKLTNTPVVSIGDTFVRIGSANTIASTITAGLAVTFSTRTNATVLKIDVPSGFVGVITDGSNGVGVTSSFTSQFGDVLIRNVGGAGTTGSVGLGTTTLTVTA
jgi:hypothetical protein